MHASLLLVEVLNISRIGPILAFADASPFDGAFTVVGAGAGHCAMLTSWLREGAALPPPLAVWTATSVTIIRGDRLHLDDTVDDTAMDAPRRGAGHPADGGAGEVSVLVP